MRQCELERVIKQRNNPQLSRTGEKLICYLDGITSEMIGAIIELRKSTGTWVLNAVKNNDIDYHLIKRNSYVSVSDSPKEVEPLDLETKNE